MDSKFVILTYGRTGSSYLCDLLNSHPDITCLYEILKDAKNPNNLTPEELIKSEIIKHKNQIIGFKLLVNQGDINLKNSLLKDPSYKIIFLKRKNYLARLTSFKLANQTGIWHLDNQLTTEIFLKGIIDILKFKYSPFEILNRVIKIFEGIFSKNEDKEVLIELTKEEILEDFKAVSKFENEITASLPKNKSIVITYEDLLENKDKTLKSLLNFLGVHERKLLSSRKKIEYLPLNKRIKNFNNLKDGLKDSEVSGFFKEIN